MKVDLSDKQCAKKHKKFFISLHFPLLLYFSLFLEAREKPKGFIRKLEILLTLHVSSEKMLSNCLLCCCKCKVQFKKILQTEKQILYKKKYYIVLQVWSKLLLLQFKIFSSSNMIDGGTLNMTDTIFPDVFSYRLNLLIVLFFRNKIS